MLDFTDHLSDRDLYCLIVRDILPSPEKKLDVSSTYLHWHCLDPTDDPDTWLRYYASKKNGKHGTRKSSSPCRPWNRTLPRQMPRRLP